MQRDARIGRRCGCLAALAGALAGMLVAGCDKDKEKNAYVPPPPPEVIVANPEVREVVDYLKYTGVLEASETVELRARVQGFLDSVKFQAGQRVKKGDVLFQIDARHYQTMVDNTAAEVEAQKAALVGAENDAKLAKELADQRAGPAIDAVIKAAKRDSIKSQIAAAEAALADARLNLEFCTVTAPIDGRIGRWMVDPGNLVGRSDPTLLAKIVQATPVFVSVDISESDVLSLQRAQGPRPANVEPGQIAPGEWRPCELGMAGDTEYAYKGRIDYVEPEMNRDTGTLRVRTRFENTDERLFPGAFANLRFAMSTNESMLVSEAALLSDQQGRFAMVVNDDDEVEVRRVQVGVLEGGMRVVTEGLEEDDRVIVLGVLKARPGSKVSPKSQEEKPPASGKSKKKGKATKKSQEAAAPAADKN